MAAWLKVGFKGDIKPPSVTPKPSPRASKWGQTRFRPKPKASRRHHKRCRQISTRPSKAITGMNASAPAMQLPRRQGTRVARNHRGPRRALQLPESFEPVAPRKSGRRSGRQAWIWAVSDPDPSNPVARTKSRRGKGAIITVSAKSVMTKTTLRRPCETPSSTRPSTM